MHVTANSADTVEARLRPRLDQIQGRFGAEAWDLAKTVGIQLASRAGDFSVILRNGRTESAPVEARPRTPCPT